MHTFGVADAIYVPDAHPGILASILKDLHYPVSVMLCGIPGEEPLSGRGDIGMSDIR